VRQASNHSETSKEPTDYRAALSRGYRIVGALLVCCMLTGCGQVGTLPVAEEAADFDSDVLAVGLQENLPTVTGEPCLQVGLPRTTTHQELFEELNRYRAERGLAPLVYSAVLEQTIDAHVTDMWQRDFFSHINPDGENPGDRAMRFGFCHGYVGENLAAGQKTVQLAMQAWKDSPSHDTNMLESGYVYVGIGFFVDPTGRRYWGQTFAYELP